MEDKIDAAADDITQNLCVKGLPCREPTYPPKMADLKMIFLFPRWDMLIPWRVKTEFKEQKPGVIKAWYPKQPFFTFGVPGGGPTFLNVMI